MLVDCANIFELINTTNSNGFSQLVGSVNNNQLFVRVLEDRAVEFHCHQQSDELFIVLSGELSIDLAIDLESSSISLGPGDVYTLLAGVQHRARAAGRATFLTVLQSTACSDA